MLKESADVDPWVGSTFKGLMQNQGTYFRFEDDPIQRIYVTLGVEMMSAPLVGGDLDLNNITEQVNPMDDDVINWQGGNNDVNGMRSSFICR